MKPKTYQPEHRDIMAPPHETMFKMLGEMQADIRNLTKEVSETKTQVKIQNGNVADAHKRINSIELKMAREDGGSEEKKSESIFFDRRAQTIALWATIAVMLIFSILKR